MITGSWARSRRMQKQSYDMVYYRFSHRPYDRNIYEQNRRVKEDAEKA